ncbi:MAG: CARDB domain-containing protein [Planctomycetaceae bacterium]
MRKFLGSLAGVRPKSRRFSGRRTSIRSDIDCLESRLLLAADLVPTQLQSVAAATPGQTIDIQWAVRNSGADAAGAFGVEFYLSTDLVAGGPDDAVLGSDTVAGLAATSGTTGTRTISVTLPDAQDPFWSGDKQYFLLIWADAFSVIDEANEDNNTLDATVNVTGTGNATGDLTGTLTVPATGAAGGSINADWTVTFAGTGNEGPFDVEFLVSLDDKLDASDVSLGIQRVNTIGAGATVSRTTSLPLPASGNSFWTGNTTYFILMNVDSQLVVPESDETNNLASDSLSVTNTGNSFADLTGVLMLPTSPVDAGTDLSFTWEVSNDGVARSVATNVEFFLTGSPFSGPGDTPFRTRSVPALNAGASNGVKTEVYTLPPSDSPIWDQPTEGTYYIVMFIDRADAVPESDPGDANNEVAAPLMVNVNSGPLPDLQPQSFTPPASGVAGTTITASWEVINTGQGAAGAFGTMFYLSDEQGITPMSVLLTTANTTSLAGNNTKTGVRSTGLPLPAGGDPIWSKGDGTYYLVMAVDDFGAVTESNEFNNTSAIIPITITNTDGTGTTPTLDIDLSGGTLDIFTDGILIARHMVGFTGANLVRNAVAAGASRPAAADISAFLNGPGAVMLDVDGNGTHDVFTDGILIARYMVGFTGTPLIRNAVGSGATRTTAAAILAFLNTYNPPATIVAPSQPAAAFSAPAAPSSGATLFSSDAAPSVTLVSAGGSDVGGGSPSSRVDQPSGEFSGNTMIPGPVVPTVSDDLFGSPLLDSAFSDFDDLLAAR